MEYEYEASPASNSRIFSSFITSINADHCEIFIPSTNSVSLEHGMNDTNNLMRIDSSQPTIARVIVDPFLKFLCKKWDASFELVLLRVKLEE